MHSGGEDTFVEHEVSSMLSIENDNCRDVTSRIGTEAMVAEMKGSNQYTRKVNSRKQEHGISKSSSGVVIHKHAVFNAAVSMTYWS